MTIQYVHGNLLIETHGILVHGCNSLGYFNKGIAKQIRDTYPQAYQDYILRFRRGNLFLGDVVCTDVAPNLIIVSGITQDSISSDPKIRNVSYNAIEQVFRQVNQLAIQFGLPVKFPMIGAGLGGGDWDTIAQIIDSTLSPSINRYCFKL